jgi:hypothetical protein
MKKLIIGIAASVLLFGACDSIFPDVLSSIEKIKGIAKLENRDNTLSSPIIEGKFICKTSVNPLKSLCESENYNKKLPEINFKISDSDNVIYADKNMEINSSDTGEIIIAKPNITITFKAPLTEKSLTNVQKIKSITDNTGSAVLIFKGGDYYIGEIKINDENRKPPFRVCKNGFKIQTPNNSRLFVKNFETKNYKPVPLNISLNENNNPDALLIYSFDSFDIDTKGKIRGNFYLYGYSDIILKANPGSLIKGAIHADGELDDYGVRVEYQKPENMYQLIVCNAIPPVPDEKKNNETLLGIDSNNNGIRDDVEIWILKNYSTQKYPKTKIAIAMQYAKAAQKILENPVFETSKIINNAIDCENNILFEKAKKLNLKGYQAVKFTIDNRIINDKLRDKIFNTKNRLKEYFKFNASCNGHVFDVGETNTSVCNFNINEIGE